MAPLDPTVFIDPLDLSPYTNPPGGIDPGFTQDVIDILGNQGSPSDGFDQAAADTGAIIDALDAVLGEQDAALDAILAEHQASDPGQLDISVQGYVGTFDTGNAIVTDSAGLGVPDLGELPMSTEFQQGITAPPAQILHDFGTVHLNSAMQVFKIGSENIQERRVTGMIEAQQISGDTAVLNQTDLDLTSGPDNTGEIVHNMTMTPVKLGTFAAQVNTVGGTASGIAIWTFTVTVVP